MIKVFKPLPNFYILKKKIYCIHFSKKQCSFICLKRHVYTVNRKKNQETGEKIENRRIYGYFFNSFISHQSHECSLLKSAHRLSLNTSVSCLRRKEGLSLLSLFSRKDDSLKQRARAQTRPFFLRLSGILFFSHGCLFAHSLFSLPEPSHVLSPSHAVSAPLLFSRLFSQCFLLMKHMVLLLIFRNPPIFEIVHDSRKRRLYPVKALMNEGKRIGNK